MLALPAPPVRLMLPAPRHITVRRRERAGVITYDTETGGLDHPGMITVDYQDTISAGGVRAGRTQAMDDALDAIRIMAQALGRAAPRIVRATPREDSPFRQIFQPPPVRIFEADYEDLERRILAGFRPGDLTVLTARTRHPMARAFDFGPMYGRMMHVDWAGESPAERQDRWKEEAADPTMPDPPA